MAPRAADLERIVDDVLARGHEALSQGQLHGLLVHLAAVHQPATPEDLPGKVAFCVRCAAQDDAGDPDPPGSGRSGRTSPRLANTNFAAALLAFTGVCLLCTVPALQAVAWSIGVGVASYYVHLVGIALAPLVAWLVYRGGRRHGRHRGFRLARAGAILLAVHAVTHALFEIVPEPPDILWARIAGGVTFGVSDIAGTALLVAGAVLNLVDTSSWRAAQPTRLRHALELG